MIKRFTVPFPSVDGMEERLAYVYLPKSYFKNNWRRYPVLYMFDGHNVFFDSDATFGKSWNLGEYLDRTRKEIIVAAVECSHNPNNGRLKEYSPFTFRDYKYGMISGRGRTTMNWYVHEFKPFIDHEFRTLPDRENTFIAGSSMGGLMSLYALLEYNHVFGRAAALSPSLWTSPDKIKNMIKRSKINTNSVLYMDYGTVEFGNHDDMARTFGEISGMLMEKKIAINCRIVPGGTHSEGCWEHQIPFFVNTLLYRF